MPSGSLHLMDHPLILHKISMLRSVDTNTKDFRQLVNEIALLIGYEATRDLQLEDMETHLAVPQALRNNPYLECL